jgi:uridine kinase
VFVTNSSLYFEYPIVLSIIIISTKGSSSGKEAVLAVIQVIVIQEQNTIIKALDFYYRDRRKLDSFLMSIDIYILFNQYLFGTKAAKIIYTISYLKGIIFN